MSNYRFKKSGESRQGVEVTKRKLKINPWAIIICLLIAFIFWLNAANRSENANENSTSTAKAEVTDCGGLRAF